MPYLLIALLVAMLVVGLTWRGLGSQGDGSGGNGGTPRPRPRPRPTRPVAPDDDADFLNEIDRKLRGGGGEDKS
ncbi:hypothetical protein EH165_12050 [Nakamurella antarctica]|uniref:Uncharacterized protein n=1 Tax=Nakamurella antarctica TaxID=1902245 RepID=A0A3G8ZXL3_9ACTN|nr:hypothetical protein [Nakamurella antarctica]AZI58756.1 hypothetical protein EH165_12050 [Nakamurella antarctica]